MARFGHTGFIHVAKLELRLPVGPCADRLAVAGLALRWQRPAVAGRAAPLR